MVVASAGRLFALTGPDDPIDPSKRAPISTEGAIRPSANPPTGTGVIGNGRIPVTRAEVSSSRVATPLAPVTVTETRPKTVKRPGGKAATSSRHDSVMRASESPAAIPRLDRRHFQKTLRDYRSGAKSAAEMSHQRIRVGGKKVDLTDINRFAGPRAALEKQGIPVVSAGAQPSDQPSSTPVAIPEKAEDKRASETK